MANWVNLSTSRYQAKDLILESGALAVGITRYPPRWKLAYPIVRLALLAPSAALLGSLRAGRIGEDVFEFRYSGGLDDLGIARVRLELETITAGRDGVLLCFENVHNNERCHRRVFAKWWRQQTGEGVPELTPAQQELL